MRRGGHYKPPRLLAILADAPQTRSENRATKSASRRVSNLRGQAVLAGNEAGCRWALLLETQAGIIGIEIDLPVVRAMREVLLEAETLMTPPSGSA
jgi:hypothetical protein